MNILYIENTEYFSSNMLLGALIDMGASVNYIEDCLNQNGFNCKIIEDTLHFEGTEGKFAYAKLEKKIEEKQIPDQIKKILVKNYDPLNKSDDEFIQFLACMYAIQCFSPDYIMCFDIEHNSDEIIFCIVNEDGKMPDADTLCVGYGAERGKILRTLLLGSGNINELLETERKCVQLL